MRDWLEKAKHYLLWVYLMIVPLSSGLRFSTDREAQEHTYQYLTISLISLFVGNVWLTGLILLNVFSYIYHGEQVGSMQVLNIVFGCLLYRFIFAYFKKKDIEGYFKPILWLTFLSLLMTVFQAFHIDPMYSPQDGAGHLMAGPVGLPTGLFGINMAHGMFLSIAAVIVSYFNPWLALAFAIPIALLRSSAVFLAFGTTVLFITWFRFRKYFAYVMLGSVLFAGLGILHDQHDDPGSFRSRLPMWHMALRSVLTSPDRVIGFGPDSFRNTFDGKEFTFASDENENAGFVIDDGKGNGMFQYYSPTKDGAKVKKLMAELHKKTPKEQHLSFWDNPHCEYLNMLFQYGIIGFLLLIGFMRELWYRFYFARKDSVTITITAVLIVFFVSSLTQFPLSLARIGYLFPVFLGMFYAKTEDYA